MVTNPFPGWRAGFQANVWFDDGLGISPVGEMGEGFVWLK